MLLSLSLVSYAADFVLSCNGPPTEERCVTTQRTVAHETSVNVVSTAGKHVFILLGINKTWLLRYLLVTAFCSVVVSLRSVKATLTPRIALITRSP